ncbi:hypothetical protein IW262DRAFT_1546028 [Armillaria fumosa]|nr:hypothetical protein IW262DRAFT_1546028 [Armillaria fumosa]
MRGFMGEKLKHDRAIKVEYLNCALEGSEWDPSKTWSQIGCHFEDTLIRDVRNMYLTPLMEEEAKRLIRSVDNTIFSHPSNVGWSFFRNSSGKANVSKGFYDSALARMNQMMKDSISNSGKFYLKVADGYATDDENHPWYLHYTLQYIVSGLPLRK